MAICSRCDEQKGVLDCVECAAVFCEGCSVELHSKGKWKVHQVRPIPKSEGISTPTVQTSEVVAASPGSGWTLRPGSQSRSNSKPPQQSTLSFARARSTQLDPSEVSKVIEPNKTSTTPHAHTPQSQLTQPETTDNSYTKPLPRVPGVKDPREFFVKSQSSPDNSVHVTGTTRSTVGATERPEVPRPTPSHTATRSTVGSPYERPKIEPTHLAAERPSERSLSASADDIPKPTGSVAALKQRLGGAIPMGMGGPKFPGTPMPGMGPLPGMGQPGMKSKPAIQTKEQSHPPVQPEKPPEKEQEKVPPLSRLPRLVPLTIVELAKNIRSEKLFPHTTTIGQIIRWCIKQFYKEPPKEQFVSFVCYTCLHKQILIHKGVVLDSERFLFSFPDIFERDVLDLKQYSPMSLMLKVSIPDTSSSITLKADEFDSVWTVVCQIIKKVHTRQNDFVPTLYGLFCDDIEMNENDLMQAYKDKLSNLVFKKKDNMITGIDLRLYVAADELTLTSFDSKATVEQCIWRFLKQHYVKNQAVVQNPYDYGFRLAASNDSEEGIWMHEKKLLGSFGLSETNVIEFRKRVRDYQIDLPGGTVTHTLSFDSSAVTQECFDVIVANYPELFEIVSASEFNLTVKKDSTVVDMDTNLWSVDSENQLMCKRKQYPLVVFMGNYNQRTIFVDYSAPVYSLMPLIWNSFGIPAMKSTEYIVRRLSPDAIIDHSKSLAAQDIQHNSTVIIKFVDVQKGGIQPPKSADDVNIWEEETSPKTQLFDSENRTLRAATLNKLVEHLTSATNSDLEFVKAFLMTFASFTTAEKFLQKLIERYNVPQPNTNSTEELDKWTKTVQRTIQLRVCNALKSWMESYWQDFDHDLTAQVVNFVDNLPNDQKQLVGKQIHKAILQRTCGLKTRDKAHINVRDAPDPIMKFAKKKGDPTTLFDYDELEIARQLALIDFDYYEKIMPVELLNQNWAKEKTKFKSPNVLRFIQRSNVVSMWIVSLILEPERVALRAKRFAFLIKVAENLRNLNNFSSLMAFLGGFNNSAITRLKFTQELLPKKSSETLAELENLMSVASSSKNYREALHNSNPPCIPYIGTYLSDLTFIDEGNPDIIQGLVNFSKRKLTYGVISEMQRYQQVRYQFRVVSILEKFLNNLPTKDEKQMYDMSLAREPRGAEKVL